MLLSDSTDVVAVCERLGYLVGCYQWTHEELVAFGWQSYLTQTLASIADSMESAVVRVIALSTPPLPPPAPLTNDGVHDENKGDEETAGAD